MSSLRPSVYVSSYGDQSLSAISPGPKIGASRLGVGGGGGRAVLMYPLMPV